MLFLDNRGITDPTLNLAMEEYALKNLDPENTYFLFYINEPSIIIGKNQNTAEEINASYVNDHNIHVVRRLSGGGAVYHDLGNLNFSFITKDDGDSFHNFRKFTEPVIEALKELGVNAELSGRNDLLAEGRKISGNAQFSTRGRMFSHGTLLFDSDIDEVVNALNVKLEKIQSKGIKSVRSRVANIKEFLKDDLTILEFKDLILQSIFKEHGKIERYEWTDEDIKNIKELAESRYRNWDWNFGKSPKCNIQQSKRFAAGSIDLRLDVNKGIIENVKIYGDFFGVGDVSDIEQLLIGSKFDQQEIENKLNEVNFTHYFGNVTKEEFMSLLF
ncbi:lipoate--protein ligase [Gottfriedia acidiceleris]|uniref:lipoate--protein ligase n=1 Tax=Gottfriedia acidiceleris TaxID=371036 RepID=A0ABY4JI31_9BACI|nr:lipoate--protein ligase [Gottfriedia acidiceleris]UPM53487.1 lipoate--protein ligase [Gottfriedia acidiceleris]